LCSQKLVVAPHVAVEREEPHAASSGHTEFLVYKIRVSGQNKLLSVFKCLIEHEDASLFVARKHLEAFMSSQELRSLSSSIYSMSQATKSKFGDWSRVAGQRFPHNSVFIRVTDRLVGMMANCEGGFDLGLSSLLNERI
jgi:hypothetical protein